MTDADFEGKLPGLFQTPLGLADTARLKDAVLRRVEREDRRRRFAVASSALVGVAITSTIIAASGVMTSARGLARYLWATVPMPSLPRIDVDLNGPWAVAVIGLLLAGLFATRAARDF